MQSLTDRSENTDGTEMRYTYDVRGRMTESYNELNHVTKYTYDAVGNALTVTDPKGNQSAYTYDETGNVTETYIAGQLTKKQSYDLLHRVARTADGRGNETVTAYFSTGQVKFVTDPLGHETKYEYDGNYNRTREIDALGNETVTVYDALSRVTSVTDARGGATRTDYDTVGNATQTTDANGQSILRDFDENGNLTHTKNRENESVSYEYDVMNREVRVTDELNHTRRYEYDLAGNKTAEIDENKHRTVYTCDGLNRQVTKVDPEGGILETTYEPRGNVATLTTYGANGQRSTTTYAYDAAGNLSSEVSPLGDRTSYEYDADNSQIRRTDRDGKVTTYASDALHRQIARNDADGATRYEYDKSGNLTRETAPTGVSTYTYTAQNKLQKGVTATGQTSEYTYNALGVRVKNVQTRRNWNAGHMNVLPDNGSIYLHDYLPSLSDNREIWQPTWETEVGTTVQNDMETVTKNYVTDYLSLANRDIMVKNEGQYVQRYVYGADSERVSVFLTYAEKTQRGQSGENLASDFAANDTEKVWYRHSLLDSTLIAVDKNGEQVAHMSYDAWGNPETETKLDENFAGIDNLNNFTGYTYDETLELYFAQNRFYDPKSHRFTQQDPVKDGENWYAYCGSSPTVSVDVWGLKMIPLKSTAEGYGGTVTWYEDSRKAQVTLFGKTKWYTAKYGDDEAAVNA